LSSKPLFEFLGPITNQGTDFDELRTASLEPPAAESGQADAQLAGYFLFRQKILHDTSQA
jgi:hypothetical protein